MIHSIFSGLITGFISGFLASFIFWLYIKRRMSPNVIIAPFILYYKPYIHKDYHSYSIRILNNEKNKCPLYDLRFHLRFRKEYKNLRISKTIPLLRDNIFILDSGDSYDVIFFVENNEFLKKEFLKAFSTDEDFNKIYKNDFSLRNLLNYFDYLEFNVKIIHEKSNISKILSKRYKVNDLVFGEFKKLGTLEFKKLN